MCRGRESNCLSRQTRNPVRFDKRRPRLRTKKTRAPAIVGRLFVVTPNELATELDIQPKTLRAWLRKTWPRAYPNSAWILTAEQIDAASSRWPTGRNIEAPAQGTAIPPARSRAPERSSELVGSDEEYVLRLLEHLVGEACLRQHRFDWLLGDPNAQGRQVQLPVDGYWPSRRLVVEYRELQHDQSTPFFDKTDRITVSGVHRGKQRQFYDQRRDELIPTNGYTLLVIRPAQLSANSRGRLLRIEQHDRVALSMLLSEHGIQLRG
jgi:hypothetical protein